jgi:hypothetical protein
LKPYIKNLLDTTKEIVFDLSYSIHVDNNRGYFWTIIDASRIEDSVACIIAVGEIMEQNSFPQQCVSAVFEDSSVRTESCIPTISIIIEMRNLLLLPSLLACSEIWV